MKKLAVQLFKELTSLTDAIPSGFKGFFAKSSGLFFKNSDGTEKQIATSDHKFHAFSTGQYFYDDYSHANYLRLFMETASFDAIRFQIPTVIEYFDGTSFVPWAEGDTLIKNLLDGREDTQLALDHTHRNFRFEITKSTYPLTSLIVLQSVWSAIVYPGCTITIESWDTTNLIWILRDTVVFSSPNTSNNFGVHMKVNSSLHDGSTKIRININFNDWIDGVGIYSGYTTIPLRRFCIFSNYSGQKQIPFTWDWTKKITTDANLVSNETINFDANIEPTQTGASVVKSSTWMWQYLAQGIKWLRANFANYSLTTHNHNLANLAERNYSSLTNIPSTFTPAAHSHTLASLSEKSYNSLTDKPDSLPANGGNSDTLDGLHASAFAKSTTAFMNSTDIVGNTATTAVFVIDAGTANYTSNDLSSIIANDISLPSGSTDMVLVLQPGTYKINSAIDFSYLNVKAIIGLDSVSTVIEVADSDLISNLELIKNVSIDLIGNTNSFIFSDSLSTAKAMDCRITYKGTNGYDVETVCFSGYSSISNCEIYGIIGIAEKSDNISNIRHELLNINNYGLMPVFKSCHLISNYKAIYSTPITTACDSAEFSNCLIEIQTTDSLLTPSFYSCIRMTDIYIVNSDIGFYVCEQLASCSVKSDPNNSDILGFGNCHYISNCKATAYKGYRECSSIASSEAIACNDGFCNCSKISASAALSNNNFGFTDCSGLVNNKSEGNNSKNYVSSYADMTTSYPVSDSPNGGFNS